MSESLRLGLHSVLIGFLLCWVMSVPGEAAGQASGILTVKDVLALPNQTARIEAQLSGKTPAGGAAWAGVSLRLSIDGKPVATGKTNEGGEVIFEYMPKMRGTYIITVSIDGTASVSAETTQATLCVWERRRPILLVELAAIMQPNLSATAAGSLASTGPLTEPPAQPVPDAAEELSRLTQYYYNVVYVPTGEQSSAGAASVGGVRRWLETHKFPAGFVMTSASGDLNAAIEAVKQGGWTTMKTGIGRTRSFAETLLHHRMEVVVVPELLKGELPRKAKAAKEWKEVRKKL
ncbi:MAG: hypothetical protein ACXW39_05545 [Nitrospira sp.]